MMYRVKRSFVDPFTGRVWLRGKPYMVTDKMQAKYLEAHGVIEHIKVEEKAPAEQSAGANASGKQPKRRKRGGSRGAN